MIIPRPGLIRKQNRRLRLWERQNRICPWCGEPITGVQFRQDATVDHWRPRSHGGPDSMLNLRLLHRRCNQQKADFCPDEFCDSWHHGYRIPPGA